MGVRARRSADAAASAAAIGPFMSAAPPADEAAVVVELAGRRIVAPGIE